MDLLTRTSGYLLLIADDAAQVEAAQRLRYDVFAGELGATLHTSVPGRDVDEFDAVCDHLVVRDDATGAVVGTYRMLPPGRSAKRYGDTEFDLSALDPLREVLVETGRSCVHPDHRTGAVINLMWPALPATCTCTADGGSVAAPLCRWKTAARPRPRSGRR